MYKIEMESRKEAINACLHLCPSNFGNVQVFDVFSMIQEEETGLQRKFKQPKTPEDICRQSSSFCKFATKTNFCFSLLT